MDESSVDDDGFRSQKKKLSWSPNLTESRKPKVKAYGYNVLAGDDDDDDNDDDANDGEEKEFKDSNPIIKTVDITSKEQEDYSLKAGTVMSPTKSKGSGNNRKSVIKTSQAPLGSVVHYSIMYPTYHLQYI